MKLEVKGLVLVAFLLALAVFAWATSGTEVGAYPLVLEQGREVPPPDPLQHPIWQSVGPGNEGVRTFPPAAPDPIHALKVPVLMYHHVGDPPPGSDSLRVGLTVNSGMFLAQMHYLRDAGFTPITQKELFDAQYYGVPLPPKPVLLTFDDGYDDNYNNAAPTLIHLGFPATFYVLTGKVGVLGYMTWPQIIELDARGFDVGSHAINHRDLTAIPVEEARQEIAGSAAALTEQLGHHPYWFCYPSGKFNGDVANLLHQSGYRLAASTIPGDYQHSDAPYILKRYRVEASTSMEEFVNLLN